MVLDNIAQTPQIKALRAAIPYLEPDNAMKMSIVVKLLEIKSIIEHYKSLESEDNMDISDLEKLFNSELFASFDGDSKMHIQKFMQNIKGKSHTEIIPLFMALLKKLGEKDDNANSTTGALLNTLKDNLSPEDKLKFEMMAKMLTGGK